MASPSLTCPACQVIDRADGVEDGKLYKTAHYPVGNERAIVSRIKHNEDRVADRVTAFAGSLQFVYIHSVWFAIWIAINVGLFVRRSSSMRFRSGCSR